MGLLQLRLPDHNLVKHVHVCLMDWPHYNEAARQPYNEKLHRHTRIHHPAHLVVVPRCPLKKRVTIIC